MEILRTPLAAGVAHVTFALLVLMAATAWLEGGARRDERSWHSLAQVGIAVPAVLLLGAWSRRITVCTAEERPVPWGGDPRDETSFFVAAGHYVVSLFLSLAPLFVWTSLNSQLGAPPWVSGIVMAGCLAVATLHFPFAHASVTMRSDPLGALPSRSRAAWRADRAAAKITILPSGAFFALAGLSILLSGMFNPRHDQDQPVADHTTLRDVGRAGVFVLRGAAVWAALVTARVAGLLVRDVPAIREVLTK
jgi:hypothetical protein